MKAFEANLNGDFSEINGKALQTMQRSMMMPMQRSMKFQKAPASVNSNAKLEAGDPFDNLRKTRKAVGPFIVVKGARGNLLK